MYSRSRISNSFIDIEYILKRKYHDTIVLPFCLLLMQQETFAHFKRKTRFCCELIHTHTHAHIETHVITGVKCEVQECVKHCIKYGRSNRKF